MYKPVIIIGAARSGTNILRDVLCRLPGLGTWPCDEINTIWRYGHPGWPTDELPAELATDRVVRYIGSRFERLARAHRLNGVVEKTCANSLRVPYVNAVLPNARYVWIIRDPVDCVASARKRWSAPMDWGYTLRKARYVPLRDVPAHGLRFIRNRFHRITSKHRRVAAWGPIFEGMSEELARHSLTEVCAMQWEACVGRSAAAFADMAPDTWMAVRYEDFVRDPVVQLAALSRFLGLSFDDGTLESAASRVSARSVGKGRGELGADDLRRVEGLVSPTVATVESVNTP